MEKVGTGRSRFSVLTAVRAQFLLFLISFGYKGLFIYLEIQMGRGEESTQLFLFAHRGKGER